MKDEIAYNIDRAEDYLKLLNRQFQQAKKYSEKKYILIEYREVEKERNILLQC